MKKNHFVLATAGWCLAGYFFTSSFGAYADSAPKLTGHLATNVEPRTGGAPYRLELDGASGSMLLRGDVLTNYAPGTHLLVQGPIKTAVVHKSAENSTPTQPASGASWQVVMEVIKAHKIQSPFGFNDSEGAIYAWQQTNQYRAPDFEAYFPDDPEGARRLESWWKSAQPESRKVAETDEEIMDLLRRGLRQSKLNAMPLLRWFGNRYIWGKSPQNAEAIEIMYHAADQGRAATSKYSEVRHCAIYFGLSVVQPKTPAILRALAEIALVVDDPNDLSRIAWGVKSQQAEFLKHLAPSLTSSELAIKSKALVVQQMVTGELNAFEWATQQARQSAQAKFADKLPAYRQRLAEGNSDERQRALDEIGRERIYLIMDESFLDAFGACAKDEKEAVRYAVVRIVGEHWIWNAKDQSQKAIDQMLSLTHDPSARVRYYAVYSGLSTVRKKSEAVVQRLVEMMIKERDQDLFRRIVWGFQADREPAIRVLEGYCKNPDSETAKHAREAYRALAGREYGAQTEKTSAQGAAK